MTATIATVRESRRRALLMPLATLLAAASIVAASGATFSHSTANTVSTYATGSMQTSNSKDGAAIFELTNLKPGDTVNGTVTITNTGSLPVVMSVTETATNGFVDPTNLVMTVTEPATGATIYSGTFGGFGTQTLGTWVEGDTHTYNFSVTLKLSAPNAEQNKIATASYTWDGVQDAVITVDQ